MTDVHSKAVRSHNMSQIKGRDTKPEEIVRKYLFSKGLRYRKNVAELPGKPDIVFPKYRVCVFVNGCFWHKHDCRYFVWPKSNVKFWKEKITRNIERDEKNSALLLDAGWRVIVVWECELKKDNKKLTLDRVYKEITTNQSAK